MAIFAIWVQARLVKLRADFHDFIVARPGAVNVIRVFEASSTKVDNLDDIIRISKNDPEENPVHFIQMFVLICHQQVKTKCNM